MKTNTVEKRGKENREKGGKGKENGRIGLLITKRRNNTILLSLFIEVYVRLSE